MTPLRRPVRRKVPSLNHGDLVVTLSEEGIYLRQLRHRQQFLLPYGAAFVRAAFLHADRARAEKQAARRTRRTRR
jgi:hypothetical protein